MNDIKKTEVAEAALTASQCSAITVLAGGGLKKDAAAAANVTPQTVSVWLGQPVFRAGLDATRQELAASCRATLKEAANAAVRAILELLSSESDATRLKAACYVLDRLILIGETAPDELSESDVRKVDVQKLMAAIGV